MCLLVTSIEVIIKYFIQLEKLMKLNKDTYKKITFTLIDFDISYTWDCF